jgi:uncharacterized cupredoxin-like copper-binding protein
MLGMHSFRTLLACLALTISVVAVLVAAKVAAPAASASAASATVRHISVTMTDFKFKLSASRVPVGKVVFTVVNRGKTAHNFKIDGKKTPLIAPGKRATLTVLFTKKGGYAYLCTVPGHAAAGMKGRLGVGVTAGSSATPTNGLGTCTSPKTTTVSVDEFDFGFTLTPKGPIPCGTVMFKQTNSGSSNHNFDIQGVKAGALIGPGASTSFTVKLKPGKYTYRCDVLGHAEQGMIGTLTVAG